MQPVAFADRPLNFIAKYIRRHRGMHLIVLLSVLAAVLAAVGARYSMKFLVDAIAAGPENIAAVWGAVILFTMLVGSDNLLWRVGGWAAARAFPAVGADMRLDLFRHLLGHSTRFFSDRFAGALANRITTAANAVFTVENMMSWNVLPPAIAIVGSLATLIVVDWQMAGALSVAAALVAWFIARAALRAQPMHGAYAGRAAEVGGEIVDVVANHATVRAFAAAGRECLRLQRGIAAEVGAHRRALLYMEKLRVAHALCVWVLTGVMLAWGVLLWHRGSITPGDVVVVGSVSLALLQCSRDLAVALVDAIHHWSRLGEALQTLTLPHDMPEKPNAPALVRRGGRVAFEEVTFAYPGGRRVLDRVSLEIPAGQKVGIVGPSGAGKTTLLALVQRIYPVAFGRVLVDGQDVAAVSQESLRKSIAVVPQEVVLFHRSVMENIRYGRPDAPDADVMAASKAARCDEFIRDLPDGYNTLVGERGMRLSGGQRQRIGIARAILADAPVVLLDEATSALDTESEQAVQRALAELMRGRTVLAVAHRLSTIASFDRVIVLKNGRIIEDGAPDELSRADGAFGRMWRLQAAAPAGVAASGDDGWLTGTSWSNRAALGGEMKTPIAANAGR
jgi:ATP-binding cassette subfamily B protein